MSSDSDMHTHVERYHRDGFTGPIDVLTQDEAHQLRRHVEAMELKCGTPLMSRFHWKAHLPFPRLWDVVAHPRILDVAESILGPDILCWGATFFEKDPHDNFVVNPHQDTTYYDLAPSETLTVWLAISEASVEAGCMGFMPGSHRAGVFAYTEKQHADSLLGRGQFSAGYDHERAVYVPLRAGQASLHHECVLHASGPNVSTDRRIGLSIHYIAPQVRHCSDPEAKAILVRGQDSHGHWKLERRPVRDFDPDNMAELDRVLSRMTRPPTKA